MLTSSVMLGSSSTTRMRAFSLIYPPVSPVWLCGACERPVVRRRSSAGVLLGGSLLVGLAGRLQERELAVRLEHADVDLGKVGDALVAGRLADLVQGQALDGEHLVEWLAVVDDDHGHALHHGPEPAEP